MGLAPKELDKLEKVASVIDKEVAKQLLAIEKEEKAAPPPTAKTVSVAKKAMKQAQKQSQAASKAIKEAKKSGGSDEKVIKALKTQASKAAKAAKAAEKPLKQACDAIMQANPKAKAKPMEKAFAEKLKFWQEVEKKAK